MENFPRLVVMFYSAIAIAPWTGTGNPAGVYNPPVRNWSFDLTFMDAAKLPPGTPQLLTMVRSIWQLIAPNKIL